MTEQDLKAQVRQRFLKKKLLCFLKNGFVFDTDRKCDEDFFEAIPTRITPFNNLVEDYTKMKKNNDEEFWIFREMIYVSAEKIVDRYVRMYGSTYLK